MFQETIRRIGDYSKYYYDGENVTKTIDAGQDYHKAVRKFLNIQREYLLTKQYLGDCVLNTQINLENSNGNYSVVLNQEYIEGTPLRNVLNFENPQKEFKKLFICCLRLYKDKGIIPDLFPDIYFDPTGEVNKSGLYFGHSGPNIFILNGKIILIDPIQNGFSRSPKTGPFLNSLLVSRIYHLLGIINHDFPIPWQLG